MNCKWFEKETFESQDDFYKNFKVNVPERFNFAFDVVDAVAA
jgi:acetyl-CoA synthetase